MAGDATRSGMPLVRCRAVDRLPGQRPSASNSSSVPVAVDTRRYPPSEVRGRMTWTKLSDDHFDHEEIFTLSRSAVLLNIEATVWCNRLGNDGHGLASL